jgi:hypothetical protein
MKQQNCFKGPTSQLSAGARKFKKEITHILRVLHQHHTNLIPYYISSSTIQDSAVCVVTRTHKCFTMALNICQSPVWNLPHDTLSAPIILRWLLEFWKTLALLDHSKAGQGSEKAPTPALGTHRASYSAGMGTLTRG